MLLKWNCKKATLYNLQYIRDIMLKTVISISCLLSVSLRTSALKVAPSAGNSIRRLKMEKFSSKSGDELPKNEEGWRTILNPAQFRVLREKSTEPSGFSERTLGMELFVMY
jgi:hypothetical protein